MDIIKPENDKRNYKYYVLDNNIKCILINDDTLDKTCVVTSVNVGSFANKEYYDGMAHLLEHMCFITSKKYKTKNYLSNKITESGGNVNAFTAELNTVYYFDVFTENIESILEIFVDFLVNAELKEEYILDELKNVDAEHKKNIQSDSWRLYDLSKSLADTTNSYNGFYTGSSKTLNKPDIYKKMVDFYNKYYNANNISICIASNKTIKELYTIANKYFGSIPKTNKINDFKLVKPFYTTNIGKTFHMEALSDDKSLEILFETPILQNSTIRMFFILSSIINSPEQNLCEDYLKSIGYISGISASYDMNGLFYIRISLTQIGLLNVVTVINYIEYAINKILLFDWIKIFNYKKKQNLFLFNHLNKIDSVDLATDFLMSMLYYKPDQIYFANYNFTNITQKDITDFKKYINFEKSIKVIVSKDFKHTKYNIDPNYKTKYTEIHLNLNKNKNKQLISYNFDNPFVKMKPEYILKINNKIPTQINKYIWYGGTSEFNEPVVYCNIMFSNKKYFDTPKHCLLTHLSTSILNYYFNKVMYKALEFKFSASFDCVSQYNSIELQLYMYNDPKYMQLFIDNVFNILLNDIILSDELIKTKIYDMTDSLNNIITSNPWSFCDYIFKKAYKNSYIYTDLLKIIKLISIEDIKKFIKTIIQNSGVNIFIYGNIKLNQIPHFDKIKNNIDNPIVKYPSLHIKKNIIYKHPNKEETSNCVKITYFIGKFKPINILHLFFIKLITSNMFFDDLRTAKQLGYLVAMYSGKIGNEYFIYQQVQSELACDHIIGHINDFNKTLITNIKKINLNKWKETVTNHLNKKETNINELFGRYYSEIVQKTFLFNRDKLLLKELDKITIDSLCLFITKYVLNNKNKSIIRINCKMI